MTRRADIDIAKGLAIILVVIGHILGRGHSSGNEWFDVVKEYIYLFHMPFFMYLSGYVFFRPGRMEKLCAGYRAFIADRAVVLLLPFVGMGVAVLLIKLASQQFMHVDNAPGGFATGLRDLFWTTDNSPSMFIWYVFVLFLYSATSPILFKLFGYRMWLWVGLGLALYFSPQIEYMYLDMAVTFFVFFAVGGAIRVLSERGNEQVS